MSDGLSDYWEARLAETDRLFREYVPPWERTHTPIVPRHDDIRVINPEPPYFWLGREAE